MDSEDGHGKHDDSDGRILLLSIDSITPNPHQPRQHFDPAALQSLADSIKTAGLMQPVLVRRVISDHAPNTGPGTAITRPPAEPRKDSSNNIQYDRYELVAGERRWRAARLAGLNRVPAIVRDLSEQQVAEWALIENVQREDLNPIERAEAFHRLAHRFQLSHDHIAQRVGINRATVTNTLRLLDLHPEVRSMLAQNLLTGGQAKVLLALSDQESQFKLAQAAFRQEWSVRRLQSAVRLLTGDKPGSADPEGHGQEPHTPSDPSAAAPPAVRARKSAHLKDLESQLAQSLSTRVHIKPGRKKGTGSLTIEFYSIDQFDTLLQKLGVEPE